MGTPSFFLIKETYFGDSSPGMNRLLKRKTPCEKEKQEEEATGR